MQVQFAAVIFAAEGKVKPVTGTIGKNVPDNGKPRKNRCAEGQDIDERREEETPALRDFPIGGDLLDAVAAMQTLLAQIGGVAPQKCTKALARLDGEMEGQNIDQHRRHMRADAAPAAHERQPQGQHIAIRTRQDTVEIKA
ncbi:hypothetical protein D3C72_1309080 [compost metagenome]